MKTFQLIKFSPVPEFLDPVNVGIILSGRRNEVVFDSDFRRLRCVAPHFDLGSLQFMLEDLEKRIEHETQVDPRSLIHSFSAQFNITTPAPLEMGGNRSNVKTLIQTYLKPIGHAPHRVNTRKRIESHLHEFLTSKIFASKRFIKKAAKPSEFLLPESQNLLMDKDFTIPRVINGGKGLVLVDGLNLDSKSRQNVEHRSEAIAYNYFRFTQVKTKLEDIEQRFISMSSILFGDQERWNDPHFDYYIEKLRKSSDLLIDSTSSEDIDALKREYYLATATDLAA